MAQTCSIDIAHGIERRWQRRSNVAAPVLKSEGGVRVGRCLECNQELQKVDKEEAFERVPPYVYLTQEEFAECSACHRVYWRGTHAAAIHARLRRWIETRA